MQEIFLDKNLLGKFPNKSRIVYCWKCRPKSERKTNLPGGSTNMYISASRHVTRCLHPKKNYQKGEFIWKIHQNISISIRERSSNFSFLLFFCSFFGGKSNSFSTLSFVVYRKKIEEKFLLLLFTIIHFFVVPYCFLFDGKIFALSIFFSSRFQ